MFNCTFFEQKTTALKNAKKSTEHDIENLTLKLVSVFKKIEMSFFRQLLRHVISPVFVFRGLQCWNETKARLHQKREICRQAVLNKSNDVIIKT